MLKKLFLLFIAVTFLVSCYSHKIYLNSDKKSGRMVIEYQLDNDYLSILSTALVNMQTATSEPIDPSILIDEKLFKESFKNTKEVTLKSVKIDTTKGYKGYVEILFTDFETSLKSMPEGMMNLSIIRNGNALTVSQILNFAKMDTEGVFTNFLEQQKEDDINLYNKLTKQASFKFEVNTSSPITKYEGVTVSKDMKKAEYSFKLLDLVNNKNKDLKFLISL
ncbi:MAG TPA: hypothetical protein PK771_00705 [Spirochaetota bacterium]|nr:hypothetical protein [Spirochaetota bacterium]